MWGLDNPDPKFLILYSLCIYKMKKILCSATLSRLNDKITEVANFLFEVEPIIFSDYWFEALKGIRCSQSKRRITKKSEISKLMTKYKKISNKTNQAQSVQNRIKLRLGLNIV